MKGSTKGMTLNDYALILCILGEPLTDENRMEGKEGVVFNHRYYPSPGEALAYMQCTKVTTVEIREQKTQQLCLFDL